MPELPEVETVKNVLLPIIKNKKILGIDILRKSTIHSDIDSFKNELINETFLNITRIGKFLIFHLSNDKVIISHLRMEGKYFELLETEDNTKYARVVFHLDNGHKICYDDSRCFGMLKLAKENDYLLDKEISKLGPEPFKANPKILKRQTEKCSLPIKSVLLDQTLMTGLGNIYVDETLFASKIHPLTPSKKITLKEWEILVNNAVRILNTAIEKGGSTIKSYHPGKDIDGNFQSELLAYGKANTKCPNCGATMRFIKVGGRGTTFCPNCQIKKGSPIKVGIYGKVASGKSTVLKAFKENGYVTCSADDIVHSLYKKKDVAKLVGNLFNLDFKNEVDTKSLREYLVNHPKDIKKLEKLIHPLVKQEIAKVLKESKTDITAIEVPLLYESKCENMFDAIIAVDIDKKAQLKRLQARNANAAIDLVTINSKHKFEENKEKADFVITNNTDLSNLNKKVNLIINKLKARLD